MSSSVVGLERWDRNNFNIYIFCIICECARAHPHVDMCVCVSGLFYHEGPRNRTLIIRLGSRDLYPGAETACVSSCLACVSLCHIRALALT